MKRFVPGLLCLMLVSGLSAFGDDQKAVNPEPKKESAAQEKDEKELPPPKTLEEAHVRLEEVLPKEELAKIDAMKAEKEMIEYHFGLGMGMRNSWGLWGGGPLADEMKKLGFRHPDDMSGVILETFWCRRHQKDIRQHLKERAAYTAAYWKAAAKPPESAKDPKDGSVVKWNMSFGAGDDKTPRQIHVGKSKQTGRWLAYEHDKGVYEPDAGLLKRIEDLATSDPFAPQEAPKKPDP